MMSIRPGTSLCILYMATQNARGCRVVRRSWVNAGGCQVVRRSWVNFQCRGVLLILIIVGQGPIALAVAAGGGCLDNFSLVCLFSFLSLSLSERARYILKILSQRAVKPKPANQPTQNARGWSGGAKVLCKLPVPGRPTILITVGQGPTALAVGAGGGC